MASYKNLELLYKWLTAAATMSHCLVNRGTMGVSSLPKTVTLQLRGCSADCIERPSHRSTDAGRAAGLLLSTVRARYISSTAHSSKCESVTLTAE